MAKKRDLQINLNLNVRGLSQSATLAINERCAALMAEGRQVFRLGLGQSPFPVPRAVVEELHAREVEDAEKNLARFLGENIDAATQVESSVRSGEPATEINRAAVDSRADLIVVGTHGRTGLSHLLMGSVAENVLREAPVPVLCVRG